MKSEIGGLYIFHIGSAAVVSLSVFDEYFQLSVDNHCNVNHLLISQNNDEFYFKF